MNAAAVNIAETYPAQNKHEMLAALGKNSSNLLSVFALLCFMLVFGNVCLLGTVQPMEHNN